MRKTTPPPHCNNSRAVSSPTSPAKRPEASFGSDNAHGGGATRVKKDLKNTGPQTWRTQQTVRKVGFAPERSRPGDVMPGRSQLWSCGAPGGHPPPAPASHSDPEYSAPSARLPPSGRLVRGDGEGLGQLKSIKPAINLHKKLKRTLSPIPPTPNQNRDTGVNKAHEVTKN